MSENERNSVCDMVLENSTAPTIGESTMKHGWCETLSNTVCCCQTPFGIALILEQVSNHNVILKEQLGMEKDARRQQNERIGDVKMFESNLNAKAKDHMCEGHEEKNNDERNEMEKEKEWLQPKKGVAMKRICEVQGMKENRNRNNSKHEVFSCDEEKDEDREHRTMLQDAESSAVATNDKNCESEVTESCAGERDHEESRNAMECKGDFKKECKAVEGANVNLVKDSTMDDEKVHAKCEKSQENSACMEAMREALVNKLKDELCRATRNSKDECCLEVEDTHE